MKTTKKAQQQISQPTLIQPRLVKAGERAAAQAIEAERKAEAKAKAVAIDPALLRTPRNANEARSMFDKLFGDKAA